MKVLFCPAHFRYTDQEGSEYYSVFHLVHPIASQYPDSLVITGKSFVHRAPYKILETKKTKPDNWMKSLTDWSTLSSIDFALHYMIAGGKLLFLNQFSIIHHVRPFTVGSTFNLLPLIIPSARKTPFVIGEFCAPYRVEDLSGEKDRKEKSDQVTNLLLKPIYPILNYLSLKTLQRAQAILVAEEDTKKYIEQYVNPEKIFVIPHGKNKDEYTFDQKKFDSDTVEILIAGNLIVRKRVEIGIKAFAYAFQADNRLRLTIAGDGIERKRLENLVQKLNLVNVVHFLGAVPYKKMSDVFKHTHLFLHCAKEEVFGHVYIEALASGVPIISTDTIGARSIITPDVGIIVNDITHNNTEIGNAILSLIKHKDLLIQMSEKAREKFEKNYDLEGVILPKVLDIYRKILNDQKK